MASLRALRSAFPLLVLAATAACAAPADPGTSPSPTATASVGAATVAPTPTPPAGGATISIPDLSDAEIDCSRIDEPCDHGDDPELDQLWHACADGDGTACDRLYYDAPFDTRYEQFGNTCGDRDQLVPCPAELD